jgi:hypothetical protein
VFGCNDRTRRDETIPQIRLFGSGLRIRTGLSQCCPQLSLKIGGTRGNVRGRPCPGCPATKHTPLTMNSPRSSVHIREQTSWPTESVVCEYYLNSPRSETTSPSASHFIVPLIWWFVNILFSPILPFPMYICWLINVALLLCNCRLTSKQENEEDKNIKIILLLIKLSLIPIFTCQLSKLMQCVGLNSGDVVYKAIRGKEGPNHL